MTAKKAVSFSRTEIHPDHLALFFTQIIHIIPFAGFAPSKGDPHPSAGAHLIFL
jgi:hypothetical protein